MSIEYRTDAEWESLAAEIVALSGVPDEDPGPLAMALKNSAATEEALQDQYWVDLVNDSCTDLPASINSN